MEEKKQELSNKLHYSIAGGLEVLDAQLQGVANILGITALPDAQNSDTLVDGLIITLDVIIQRVGIIANEIQKLK